MIPTPKVARVTEPRCWICRGTDRVVSGDGPPVCRPCIRLKGRLASVSVVDPRNAA